MPGIVYTFYSYKGGVGRTFALANIATLLCHRGHKVLVIDWDVEAPGVHQYFKEYNNNLTEHKGLVDFIEDYQSDAIQTDWRNYITEVKFISSKTPLYVLCAGIQNSDYTGRVQKLNWNALYEKHNFGEYLEKVRTEWIQEYDYILIDSRTGISETSGICTVAMPDVLVGLTTTNEQGLQGILEVFEKSRMAREHFEYDRGKLIYLPIVSRFEGAIEYDLTQQWISRFVFEFKKYYEEWKPESIESLNLLSYLRIHNIPYWSFGEHLPVLERGTSDPGDVGYAFEHIAVLIEKKLADSDTLLNDREQFIANNDHLFDMNKSNQVVNDKSNVIESEIETEEEVEEGWVDLVVRRDNTLEIVNDETDSIVNHINEISDKFNRMSTKLNQINSEPTHTKYKNVQLLSNAMANDLNEFAVKMELSVPVLGEAMLDYFKIVPKLRGDRYLKSINTGKDEEKTKELQSIMNFVNTIVSSRNNMRDFRKTVKGLPPLTALFGQAKKRVVRILDRLDNIYNDIERDSNEYINLLNK